MALLLVVAATISAGVTGYMGPSSDPTIDADTRRRFQVLHFYFLPTLMAALLAVWLNALRSPQSNQPLA